MKNAGKDSKFHKIIINDFKSGGLTQGFLAEIKELYNFYIDDKKQESLNKMSFVKRWLTAIWWMIKMMLLKLSPIRRILLLLGLFFSLTQFTYIYSDIKIELNDFGITFIVFVFMLELKDKLLAKDELEIGRKVQKALLPKKNPVLSGWEFIFYTKPAKEVGGDLVDFIEIDNNKLGIMLADVAGKGLGAALFMSKLQATIRALVPFYPNLSELGSHVNKIFRRDGLPNKFASLIFVELSHNCNKIKLLNAGHFPPYICKENKIEELSKGGAAFGLMPKPLYKEQEYSLKTNEMIFIYSDGVTEAQNSQNKFFGEKKLESILDKFVNLNPQNASTLLLNEIKKFVGTTSQSDDLSFIIIKRTK